MGRPKQFDPEIAIQQIKNLFWAGGYEGTSLSDLEHATGLPKQSLYREFGDKRAMYLKALRHYEMLEAQAAIRLLETYNAPEQAFAALFDSVIDLVESQNDRRGCFLCNASADRTTIDDDISRHVNQAMDRLRSSFARALGEIDPGYPIASALIAGYIGLRVMARAGFPVEVLRSAAANLNEIIARNSVPDAR